MRDYTPEWVTCYIVEEAVGARLAEIREEIDSERFPVGEKKSNPGELLGYAKICRIDKVMRPYLEATL